jgi:hypothetical protein
MRIRKKEQSAQAQKRLSGLASADVEIIERR